MKMVFIVRDGSIQADNKNHKTQYQAITALPNTKFPNDTILHAKNATA